MFICSSIVNKRGAIAFHQNDIVFQRHEVTTSVNKEKTYCITVSLISLSMLYHIQSLLNCFARICDSHTWRERKRKKEIETEKERVRDTQRKRETHTEKERHGERQRETERDRETQRERVGERERESEREGERGREREREREREFQLCKGHLCVVTFWRN